MEAVSPAIVGATQGWTAWAVVMAWFNLSIKVGSCIADESAFAVDWALLIAEANALFALVHAWLAWLKASTATWCVSTIGVDAEAVPGAVCVLGEEHASLLVNPYCRCADTVSHRFQSRMPRGCDEAPCKPDSVRPWVAPKDRRSSICDRCFQRPSAW